MPELPEVETIRRGLTPKILGQRILKVLIYDERVIRKINRQQFTQNLQGLTITGLTRRGKAIIFHLAQRSFLIIQPMMTGQLIFSQGPWQNLRTKFTKLVFELSGQRFLIYNDQRLFGRLIFTRDLNEIEFLHSLGPEPLDHTFNAQWLKKELKKRHTLIKPY